MFAPVRALGRSAAKPGERHSTEREQADQSPRLARRRRSQLEEQPQDPLRRKALLAIDLAPMLNSDRSALGVKVGAKAAGNPDAPTSCAGSSYPEDGCCSSSTSPRTS